MKSNDRNTEFMKEITVIYSLGHGGLHTLTAALKTGLNDFFFSGQTYTFE